MSNERPDRAPRIEEADPDEIKAPSGELPDKETAEDPRDNPAG